MNLLLRFFGWTHVYKTIYPRVSHYQNSISSLYSVYLYFSLGLQIQVYSSRSSILILSDISPSINSTSIYFPW